MSREIFTRSSAPFKRRLCQANSRIKGTLNYASLEDFILHSKSYRQANSLVAQELSNLEHISSFKMKNLSPT